MKLELVKKTDGDGIITYYINKNSMYVSGSSCCGNDALSKVMNIFKQLKKGELPKEEIILVEEI